MTPAAPAASSQKLSPSRHRRGIQHSFNDSGSLIYAGRDCLKSGGEAGIVALYFRSGDDPVEVPASYLSLLVRMIGSQLNGRIEGGYQAARGEYFLLLVPGRQPYGADAFREDRETVRRALGRQLRHLDTKTSPVDFRLTGVHLCNREGERADNVLFRALQELFSASAPTAGIDEADRGEIVKIISQGMITPVFQPIFRIEDGEVHGYEALSRLHPASTLPNPEYLFNRAVHFGLTSQLEMLCRRKALSRARELELPGRLFLNVCPSIFLSSDHRRGATAAFLDELGLRRSDITFELTERTLIEDYQLFKRILSYYRQQGYSIAIDDLGSGYAGLKMLSELEPEYVKLSSFLIRDIDRITTKQALVESLITFCARIGAKVIAEGIETAEELQYLKKAGLVLGQGYYLAHPAPNPFIRMRGAR